MKKVISLFLTLSLLLGMFPALALAQQFGYVNAEASLYINASTKAAVVAKLPEGTKVEILSFTEEENGENFYQIKTVRGNDTGYMLEDKVDLVITRQEANITAAPSAVRGKLVTQEADYPVLTASGLIDLASTLTEEDLAQYTPLKVGSKGDDVLKLKARMHELGYFKNPSQNANFTDNTAGYVKEFQKNNNLPQTGEADSLTLAIFYSDAAIGPKGKAAGASATLEITKGVIEREKESGSTLASFTLKNNGDVAIDAFELFVVPYSAYGNRVTYKDYTESLMEEMKLFTLANEDHTIKAGGTLSYQKYGYIISLPGEYYGGAKACILSYHTTDGETHVVPDDQRVWFGVGKGVTEGTEPMKVSALTEAEKAAAEEWTMGVSSFYVDAEYAEIFQLREGAFVNTVEPGSPADAAGLEAGDIILAIGDTRIFGTTTLKRARANMAMGESCLMLYWRNGAVYATTLTRPGIADENAIKM